MTQPSRIFLFGTPSLECGGRTYALALPSRCHTLLAYLALHSDRPTSRAHLAALLWPEVVDAEARTNLRRHFHLITRALPTDANALLLTKNSAQWNPASTISCDLIEFVRAARSPAGQSDAARLYVGELCAGILDEPLETLRHELKKRHDELLRGLADAALGSGNSASAVLALHRLVQNDPLDEPTARRLVLARFEAGDRAGALREYYALIARLRSELDVDPQPETTALFEKILATETRSKTPHNLVAPSASLVGRSVELRTISQALDDCRMVSVVGPAGIGKTRLALEAGSIALDRFPAGVYFVELARDRTLQEAVDRIARVVDAVPSRKPLESLDALVSALDQKPILLILDNLEQLGTGACELAEKIIALTGASILATSRRRVGWAEEYVVAIGALQLPPLAPTDPKALLAYPAVRMFLERAIKVAPSIRLTFANARSVTAIVRRLDGIPLAIELVASRANLLTIDGIAKRLDEHSIFSSPGRDDRHRTIDAAISWSYDLLSVVEQAIFRRVAVFGDSWTVEALENVCAQLTVDCIGPISELAESSLLVAAVSSDAIRYRTFELTRSFALAKLREHVEYDETARLHAEYYIQFLEGLREEFTSDSEQEAFSKCDIESGNFEAALAWSLENDGVLSARLMAGLWRFWIFRGLAQRGADCIVRLETQGVLARLSILQRARVLQAAGMFMRETQLARARPYLDRALALFRESNEPRGEIEILGAIAAAEFTSGRHREAEVQFEACLQIQEASGDRRGAGGTLANLAQLAWVRGECEEALQILERAHDRFSQTKNVRGVAHVFRTRSAIFGTLQRFDEAVAQAQQSVALYEALGERARLAESLSNLGEQNVFAGNMGAAFEAMCLALELLQDLRHGAFFCSALRGLHLAAGRVREYQDVLRIDSVLRRYARDVGQSADTFDGTTQYTLMLARAAVPKATQDAIIQSSASMEEADMVEIVRRLRALYVQRIMEPLEIDSDGFRTHGTLS